MTRSPDRLFDLLPVVLRRRDAERGYPLRALLHVIAEQVDLVEEDIDQLYDNWFIETCEDWVVPYIGALVGYDLPPETDSPATDGARGALGASVLAPRRAVANTIRNRRRKGTLALLELLARDLADWPARAVEFNQLLAWTQALNPQRPGLGGTADLRDGLAMAGVDGPFDQLAHSVDVRRLSAYRTRGRLNIPNVGLYVWRLRDYPLTREPAYCLEELGSSAFTFSILGNDAPLFAKPDPEPSPDHIAGPLNLPIPISRRRLEADPAAFYGPDRSFAIWADGWAGLDAQTPVPVEALTVADLSGWHYSPKRGQVAIDPETGRIAFPPRQLPRKGVWVRYRYGFSDDTGGGEYRRAPTQPAGAIVYKVGTAAAFARLGDALAKWREQDPDHAVIEIVGGGVYTEQISIELRAGQSLQLRAADNSRAVLRLMDWHSSRPDALWVRGEANSRFTLDGVLVTGRSLQYEGDLAEVVIRHCTLVPGWTLGPDCTPGRPAEPSLEIVNCGARVHVERSILGSIQVNMDEVGSDPVPICLTDSILDATSQTREAVGAPSWPLAHATLTILRCTIYGQVLTHAIALAEDSLFMGQVHVARRQIGCIRFCHVPQGSRTPRRYRCQPDLAETEARATIPAVPADGPVSVPIVLGGDAGVVAAEEAPALPTNLQLQLETTNPTPAQDETFTLTLTVRNNGPRDATGIAVSITPPANDCLNAIDLQVSDGVLETDDAAALWKISALKAGDSALLSAVLKITGPCAPPALRAMFTAYLLAEDGAACIAAQLHTARQRVLPRFTSTRYGQPGYAQLSLCTDAGILRGASDSSEMGAFHDLFQPQRAAALAAQLDACVPAGMDAGIIFAT